MQNPKQRVYIMRVYTVLTLVTIILFSALQLFVERNRLVGMCGLAAAGAMLLIWLLLETSRNVTAARICLLLTMITILVLMLTFGGAGGMGILWFFVFPAAAFFLAGAREGVLWILLLLSITVCSWFASQAGELPFDYYNGIQIRQLVVTLIVVSIGLYAYEVRRESWAKQAFRSREELHVNQGQMAEMHTKVDDAKNEFVTIVSHQLRTPISAIKWSSEMLLNGDIGTLSDEQRESIQGIEDSNARLSQIVDSMLIVSYMDLGKFEVRAEPADLPSLAHKLLAAELQEFPGKKLEVNESFQEVPRIYLDMRVIRIILQNIFSNAVKYTPSGGKITVNMWRDDKKLFEGSRGSVLIEVIDNGYGIPRYQQENVFTKMFRASNAKARDTDGTGLGLFIVKSLLDRVGGRVWFESDEGKGTTMSVLLPLEGMTDRAFGTKERTKHA